MNNKLFSRLKDLARKENRARLAVLLGAAAMLLILLSELFTPSGKTAAASAAPADDNIYRQQLEQDVYKRQPTQRASTTSRASAFRSRPATTSSMTSRMPSGKSSRSARTARSSTSTWTVRSSRSITSPSAT